MLSKVMENIFYYNLNNRDILREVIIKIGLERINIQERVTVKTLLDSGVIRLVMNSKFTRKYGFKLRKNRKTYIYKKYG